MQVLCIDHPNYSEESARLEMTVCSVNKQINSLQNQCGNKWANSDEREFWGYDPMDHMVTAMMRERKLKPLYAALDSPYFARVDFLRDGQNQEHNYYIGKIGIDGEYSNNNSGERLVLDWRSPIAAAVFYQSQNGLATVYAPGGKITGSVNLRRRFDIAASTLINIIDEGVVNEQLQGDAFLSSALLAGSSQYMKDIVQTIQREQDRIIRRPLQAAIIVQGVAGSGKTAIGLHRIAYLIYTYKIKPEKIAIVAPSSIFLEYIKNVLPDLNVDHVWNGTMFNLAEGIIGTTEYNKMFKEKNELDSIIQNHSWNDEDNHVKWTKFMGSLECQNTLRMFVGSIISKMVGHVEESQEIAVKLLEEATIAYRKEKDLSDSPELLGGHGKEPAIRKDRFDNIRTGLEGTLASMMKILRDNILPVHSKINTIKSITRSFDVLTFDDAEKYSIQNTTLSPEIGKIIERINECVKRIYSRVEMEERPLSKLYQQFLFSNEMESARARVHISDFERRAYHYDEKDLAALSYLGILWEGINNNNFGKNVGGQFDHIMVDEAQDLSPFEIHVLSLISSNNSITMLGDMNQAIRTYRSIKSWEEAAETLKETIPTIDVENFDLTVGYRSAGEIIYMCNKLIQNKARSVFKIGESPKIEKFVSATDGIDKIMQSVLTFREKAKNEKLSIGIISKTLDGCAYLQEQLRKGLPTEISVNLMSKSVDSLVSGVTVLPAILSKGLEFDAVIIANANSEHFRETDLDCKILYVCMSRARYLLHIYYSKELTNHLKMS